MFRGNLKDNNNNKFNVNPKYTINIFTDASFGDDKIDRKSTCGWISTLNKNNILAWQSKKQSTVALSTTEAELYSLCEAVKEGLFMKQWFEFYVGIIPKIVISGDNQGSLYIGDHSTSHGRTKHIDIQTFFIREHVNKKEVILEYVNTKDQLADILTKCTKKIVFTRLINQLIY